MTTDSSSNTPPRDHRETTVSYPYQASIFGDPVINNAMSALFARRVGDRQRSAAVHCRLPAQSRARPMADEAGRHHLRRLGNSAAALALVGALVLTWWMAGYDER